MVGTDGGREWCSASSMFVVLCSRRSHRVLVVWAGRRALIPCLRVVVACGCRVHRSSWARRVVVMVVVVSLWCRMVIVWSYGGVVVVFME